MIGLTRKNFIIAAGVILIAIIGIGYGIKQNADSRKIIFENSQNNKISEGEVNSPETISGKKQEETITIHIIGAVKSPGIVKIPFESRIKDAIEAAGGVSPEADIEAVNLAYKLEDGQQIYIPLKQVGLSGGTKQIGIRGSSNVTKKVISGVQTEQTKSSKWVSNSSGGVKSDLQQNVSSSDSSIININTADLTRLDSLPGIGPTTAQKIIDYRNANGLFKSPEDIMKVKGIGKSKYEKLKSKIIV